MIRWFSALLGIALVVSAVPVAARLDDLPKNYTLGRCHLQIDDKIYISGPCAYQLNPDGSFEIQGPRQTYPGIDYPVSKIFAAYVSTDYFAQVGPIGKDWSASWNHEITATHAQDELGIVHRKGACWINRRARVCLWK